MTSTDAGVELGEAGGARHLYDHVILAWVPTGNTGDWADETVRIQIRH